MKHRHLRQANGRLSEVARKRAEGLGFNHVAIRDLGKPDTGSVDVCVHEQCGATDTGQGYLIQIAQVAQVAPIPVVLRRLEQAMADMAVVFGTSRATYFHEGVQIVALPAFREYAV